MLQFSTTMHKVWRVQDRKYQDLKEQFLYNRGLESEEEIENFLNPKLEKFEADFKIKNIDKSFNRVQKAIDDNELIIVYGDYDVDGVCASAILYKALSSLSAKVLPYIPHREKEGYGLSNQGLEYARDSGAAVVITVDNGIVALNQAKFAKEIGLDLIITDHHLPLEILPEAYSIVHSTQMCGAAVAWCLIKDKVKPELAQELLEFVSIATICDLMPLLGVNRAFVFEGLKQLNKTKNLGLLELIFQSGVTMGEISSYEIGHMIGPRINAIGRLEHAIDALRLVCTKDPLKAKRLAKLLCDTNEKRQKMTIEAVDQARLMITTGKKIHILHSQEWSPGIIGLIAGRITDEFYVPTIAISTNGTYAKGSARSIPGLNIVEIIRNSSDLLIDVGGHSGAAGFSLDLEKIEEFKQKIEKVMDEVDIPQDKVLEIEAEVSFDTLTKKLAKDIQKIAPFGFGNPQVVLASKNLVPYDVRTLKDGKHLKFKVVDPKIKDKSAGIDVIGFGMGEFAAQIQNGQLMDLAFNLEINKFNGAENLQLKLKDLKLLS